MSVIVTVGFIPMTIITQHLIQNALTPNRVKANLLAQEVIEYIRHARDSDILNEEGGGDWFDNLYGLNISNGNGSCIAFADDWIGNTVERYCTVECFTETGNGIRGECGTKGINEAVFDGFVAGVVTGDNYGSSNTETCDGENPKGNNQFTTTLNIVIPREESDVQYASIIPCVSWSNKNGAVKKAQLKETIFEWIRRE